MRARSLTSLACGLTLLTAAACGGTSAGTATTPASQKPDRDLPKYGAPDVTHPLDVSDIAQTPCKALTNEQVETFPGALSKHDVGESTFTGNGKTCGWIFDGDRYGIGSISGGVVLPSDTYHGLSTMYRAKNSDGVTTFRPIKSIEGYPALIYASGRTIGDGFCRLSVGLRNDTAYRITTGLDPDHPGYDNPCKPAKKLARFVVQNLKEAQ